MRSDRRGFLRMLGGALAFASGAVGPARAREGALEIHRSTRNTRLGALGERLPKLSAPPAPFKVYPGAEGLGLPPPALEPGLPLRDAAARYAPASAFEASSLSLGELGRLLHLTNGVTGELRYGQESIPLRAAPSAGALYAGEVYVVAERVRGVPKGIYYYRVAGHELLQIQLGSFAGEVGRALERPGDVDKAAAVILLSNVFGRYGWRYANRGYRYALIDSGHIGENLRLAAVSAGLAERSFLRFHDDALNALIGLDGRAEAVCAVHALGRSGSARRELSAGGRRFGEKQALAEPAEAGPAPARYHEATKLVPGAAEPSRPPAGGDPGLPSVSGVALGADDAAPPTAVGETIRQRRSALEFRREPIAKGALGFALKTARGHPALERAPGVDVLLAVHRVEGLEAGLYRYEPGAHRLALLRRGDLGGPMVRACGGQEKAGEAAVGFLMVGRIAAAAGRGGDRSYRDLLIESGAIGQRVYLAAEALGLAARNLAAFRDDELNRLARLDGQRSAVIHLTMLGPGN
jgi:SagB-type dehydrogenase family enzyme